MPFDGFTHWTSDLEPQHSRPKSRLEKNPEEKWGVLDLSLIKPRARRENARVYDKSATAQTVGRYVEADPLGLGAGPNLYAYGGDNPTQNIDPLGLDYIKYMFDQLRPGAYQNGVLNTGRDTGHVAVQRYSDDGVLLNSVSVGPVGNVSNSAYMLWGQQSTSNYPILKLKGIKPPTLMKRFHPPKL